MFYQCYHDRSWQIMMISLTTNILYVLNENGIINSGTARVFEKKATNGIFRKLALID